LVVGARRALPLQIFITHKINRLINKAKKNHSTHFGIKKIIFLPSHLRGVERDGKMGKNSSLKDWNECSKQKKDSKIL
jgi:hypothetical protein